MYNILSYYNLVVTSGNADPGTKRTNVWRLLDELPNGDQLLLVCLDHCSRVEVEWCSMVVKHVRDVCIDLRGEKLFSIEIFGEFFPTFLFF